MKFSLSRELKDTKQNKKKLANHTTDKKFIPRIYKEPLQPNKKRNNLKVDKGHE